MKAAQTMALLSLVAVACAVAVAIPSKAAAPPVLVTPSVHLASATPDSLQLVWRFEIADQWHLYGPFRNDTGFAPSVVLQLPEGWTADPLGFPVPARKISPGEILDHIYRGELLLTQIVRTGGGTVPRDGLTAHLFWLACRELCVPGQDTLTVALSEPPGARAGELWQRARAAQPAPIAPDAVGIARDETTIRLAVAGARRLVFIPGPSGPLLADLLGDGETAGYELVLRLRPGPSSAEPLAGLLSIDYKDGRQHTGTIVIP